MVVQWVAAIVIALVVSPRTWSGQSSQIHFHVWAAIFIGGVISVFPIWMTRAWPGATATRYVIAVAQMLMSALLIDLTGGRIETHFHVFGSLVILSFYRDWRVLIPATIIVYIDHILRGIYWPYSVYGVLAASPWRSIEHAGWVIFEDIFLVISCLRGVREIRFMANRAAALENSATELTDARDEAERANHAKDNFLAALSHELRTPLTPVLMSAAALEQKATLDPELRQQLGMMRRNIELEARLIDDLLDLTRVSHGKLNLVVSDPVDVHSLLQHTEQIVRGDAFSKPIHLDLELTAADFHVAGDAARLHQVFWNLLKNAIKFTPAQGRIVVRTTNPAPGKLTLTVVDNGIGIDQETLPLIFRAFQQGAGRQLHAGGGLGLGLSISKAIVDLHGGTIRAESAGLNRGAVFTIELDTVIALAATQSLSTERNHAAGKSCRLLVVEDHEATLNVITALLRQRGHHVHCASSIHDALGLAANHKFDFVISDLGLPDGSGIDLMLRLSNEYGLHGIALSGYGMAEDLARSEQAGFLAHLVKPINFEQLHRALERFAPAA
ncbi:MAG: hypothetical protein QOG48_555 [Verrucomicrobiota bacterium]